MLKGEIVLITGGSGFIGQHLVRVIQERDPLVKEIRIVDLKKYENRLGHVEHKKVVSYVGDIRDPKSVEIAFQDVDCVFHCVGYDSIEFPPNLTKLEEINVTCTGNIIELCIKNNIPRLIYTSTALLTLAAYMGRGTFCFLVNQTETKARPPEVDSKFLIASYGPSKYRAEKLVLSSCGRLLANGEEHLKTIAIRPPVTYGEQDYKFFPRLIEMGQKTGGKVPKIGGAGGKHQMAYAGNVAWAHIRAKDILDTDDNKVLGMPIFVTDNTPIEDTFRFCQRISRGTDRFKLAPTWWQIPAFISYFIAFFIELFITLINKIARKDNLLKLNYSPCSIASYTSSIFMFNRLRASLYLDYEPIYDDEKSIMNSTEFYEKWFDENIFQMKSKNI